MSTFNPSNPNNPYDFMGVVHNEIIEDIVNVIDSEHTFETPIDLMFWLQRFSMQKAINYTCPSINNNDLLKARSQAEGRSAFGFGAWALSCAGGSALKALESHL
jgi:hypothetical protein